MAANQFIWADLAAKEPEKARRFYQNALGWELYEEGKDYYCALKNQSALAAIYTMPEKFRAIDMPAFWMSYIEVDDIYSTVEQAGQLGAKIEVAPETAFGSGLVALIRDPAGAGFTCYQPESKVSDNAKRRNLIWHELHVNQISLVSDFYKQLFAWKLIKSDSPDRTLIQSKRNIIGSISQIPDSIKGPKQYWAVYFLVENLDKVTESVKSAGGQLLEQSVLSKQPAWLVNDNQGAAFFIAGNDVKTQITRPKVFIPLLIITILVLLLVFG